MRTALCSHRRLCEHQIGSAGVSRILCRRIAATVMTIYLRDYYPDVSIPLRGLASGPPLVLFCLAPHGVYRASFIAVGAVGSYPAISPLPATPLAKDDGRFVFCDTFHCCGLRPQPPTLARGMLP